MILCVTLNPCLDKTLTVRSWAPGENVRGVAVDYVVGGKGNNVARAIKRLGIADVRPVTFLGGVVGVYCDQLLRDVDHLDPITIGTMSQTRVITTIRCPNEKQPTAFFDPDPTISAEEAEAMRHSVESLLGAGGVTLLTLSGSSPSATTHAIYAGLVARAREARTPVLLDTYGPAFDALKDVWPEAIHVNRQEASGLLDKKDATDDDLLDLLHQWANRGVRLGVITDGSRPVLANLGHRIVRAIPPPIDEVNPVGSGDCLVAGLAAGWQAGRPPEHCLRLGLAAGAANAATWLAGDIDRPGVEALLPATRIEILSGD